MIHLMRVSLISVVMFLTGPALAADVCALLTRAEVSDLLGQPVTGVTPVGPETDEDSGGRFSYCTYRAASAAAVLTIVEFASAVQAGKQVTEQMVAERMDANDAKITPENGIADKAFWAVSAEAAAYSFLKGAKVVQIGIGGPGLGQPASHKDALRSMAMALAKRL